jgi:DNA-binding transcriptional LysR family regulator
MEWQQISFDWNQIRAFLATVEEGSLSAAARALRLTQPTLGRQVAALEDALGVALFERSGQRLQLTNAGLELVDHVRAMGEAATRVSLAASGQSQAVQGLVRITASDVLSTYLLPAALEPLQQLAPNIEIEIVAANDIRDLSRREADIAIRHVASEDPHLISVPLRDSTAHLYAASSYLDRHGLPRSAQDFTGANVIGMGDTDRLVRELNMVGIAITAENIKYSSDNGVVAWAMVQRGMGIGVMFKELGDITPEVDIILPDSPTIQVPMWLTTHRELHTSRRIRVVFDLLAEAFG